ncbi:sulfite exporter TauE/SafE family protein [Desulfoscipio gibsoniae]|uniref:Probable membrane transporter protein n=1 Tax=Desulfoscipio gibsoniae DSM 7213 TaxID=767817 RepID=R4KKT8_9FIRM|nr:sulfite exporter TauE/SafE family protein [Desulfoscipio gibsoniae]AGL00251.1 putative permease [Desulfoscipio gibsoniae DSM 7213]
MEIAIVLIVGIIAGFVNVVGGGGSLITLPVLILLGLPSAVANGTNRIALMVQSIVAIGYFKNKGYFYPKLSVILGIPALVGSILGAKFAISMSDALFNRVLAIVMLVVLVLIILRPEKWFLSEEKGEDLSKIRLIAASAVFFAVGFYGGFIQAGIGFIIISALALITGMSLVKINSLKVAVTLIYMSASMLVFIFSGKVDWVLGLALAAGNALGAYLGGIFTVSGGDKWIRIFLVVTVSLMSAKLLGIHKILF